MKKSDEISLKDLLGIFLPKLWMLVLVGVIVAGAFGLYSGVIKEDSYKSSLSMYVYKSENSATTSDIAVAKEMVNIYRLIIETDEVLNMIIGELPGQYKDYNITTSSLRSMLTVSSRGNTGAFTISVTASDPALAHDIAESVENIVPSEIKSRIPNALQLTIIDSPRYGSLVDKNVTRNIFVGFIAGFVFAAVVVWIINVFDVVIRDKKKIEDNFDLPILGVIPRHDVDVSGKEAA